MKNAVFVLGLMLLLGLLSACDEDSTGHDGEVDSFTDGDAPDEGDDPDGDDSLIGVDGDDTTDDDDEDDSDGDELDGDEDGDDSDGDELDGDEDGDDPDGDELDGDEDGDDSDGDELDGDEDGDDPDGDELDGDEDGDDLDGDEEEETEPPIACDEASDPLLLWSEIALPQFSRLGESFDGQIRTRCQTDGYLFAGARGMTVTLTLEGKGFSMPLAGSLLVSDAASISGRREGTVYLHQSSVGSDSVSYSFTLPYSGEYLVAVHGREYSQTGSYTLHAVCEEHCDRHFTRFPIAMMHGFAGWDTMIGIYEYFFNVEDDLEDRGYEVHTTEVAMFNDSELRAQEVESQLMDILTETGARKLSLIAHSQGGLDARRFISGLGHGADVAVLAMVATPNDGSLIGDMILGNVPGIGQDILAGIVDFFGNLIGGSDNDVIAALGQLSVQNMRENFNPAHPDDPRVEYWSWSGYTCALLDGDCRDAHDGEWRSPMLIVTHGLMLDGPVEEGYGPNDGLVTVNSATYGTFWGSLNADHWDEIGQLTTGGFDHIGFYRNVAQMLENENY